MTDGSGVAVVIPSVDGDRGGNVARLREDLERQTMRPDEVEVVVGVRPCGRAHNEGVRRTTGPKLVFLDDDVRLGHDRVIENLVGLLDADPSIGIVGASQLPPPDATAFQRRVAERFPRMVFPVVETTTDTDMATHAGMAIRRDLYERVGGEPEDCWRADDQVLRAAVRRSGLRVVVAPMTWVYHPPPPDRRSLLRRAFRGGIAAAHDARTRPEAIVDLSDGTNGAWGKRTPLPLRALRRAGGVAGSLATGRWLPAAAGLVYGTGYLLYAVGLTRPREPL